MANCEIKTRNNSGENMFFNKKPKTEWQPEPISKIKRELKSFTNKKVQNRARIDARNKQPVDAPKNAPKYSGTENNLFSLADMRYKELCSIYETSRQNLVKSIEYKYSIDVLAPENKSNFVKNLHGEIDTAFTEEKVNLHTLARNELRAERDLKEFQANNDVYHTAKSARPISWIVFILLTYLLVESIFNMFIFQDISDAGLLGGFVLAASCSAANVIMGFFCGHGGRLMVHISWFKKFFGFIIFTPMIVFASIWNLFIAHFREAVIEQYSKIDSASELDISNSNFGISNSESSEFSASNVAKIAIDRLKDNLDNWNVEGINDITSYLLLLIGISVFIAVAWKIYNQFSDPYPNYSKKQDTADRASNAWLQGQNDSVENIKNIVRKHKNDWDRQIQKSKQKISDVQDAINSLVAHRGEIVGNMESIKHDVNRALQVYRDRNAFLREGFRPPYFNNWVEFPAMAQETDRNFLPIAITQDKLDKLKKNLEKNEKIFASMTLQANEVQTDYLNGIQPKLDAIYAKETRSMHHIQQDVQQETTTTSSKA